MKLNQLYESQTGFIQFDLPCDVVESDGVANDREIAGTIEILIRFKSEEEKKIVMFMLTKSKPFINWINDYVEIYSNNENFLKSAILQQPDSHRFINAVSINTEYVIKQFNPKIVSSIPDTRMEGDEIFFQLAFGNIKMFFHNMSIGAEAKQLISKHFGDIEDYIELPW